MGICSSKSRQKEPEIKQNSLVQGPTNQLKIVNDTQQKQGVLDKRLSAIMTPDTTRQVDIFTNRSKMRTQTQIAQTVEMKSTRNVSGKRQFRNIYTICNLSQHTQIFTVQENQTGKICELIMTSKSDSQFLAQQIWIQNTNKNNFHMCQVLDIFMEQKSLMIVKEKFNSGSFAQLIKQKELNTCLTSELFLQMLDICQFMEEKKLQIGETNLDSFELEMIGDCYIVKYCNQQQFYNVNQNMNTNNNDSNILQIIQISLQLLLKQRIDDRITTKNISEFVKNLPPQVISDDLFQQFKNFLLRINSTDMKCDIQTILNDPFIIKIKEQQSQKQMLRLCKPIVGKKLSYFQFCVLAYMVQEFQPDYAKLYLKLFQQADHDKNGKISREEFTQCYQNNMQTNLEMISQIFENIDIVADNQIDFQEFIVGMIDKEIILSKENLKKAFSQLQNKNGVLTVQSLSKLIEADVVQLKKDLKSFGLKNLYYEDFVRAMSTIENF